MIALILVKKIISLFIMMFLGFALVKLKLAKPADSKILSVITLNLVIPCAIIMAFQVDYTEEIKDGLIFSFGVAIVLHLLLILISHLLGKFFHYDGVERNSIIISNAGNLIIPIVTAILGQEWIIYTTGFMSVQIIVLWTYGKVTLCGEKKADLKAILLNVNLLAVLLGILCFIAQIKIPEVIGDSLQSIGNMIGPLGMLITGILIAGMDFRQITSYKKVWMISAFRLVIIPMLMIGIMRVSGSAGLVTNGSVILLISLLATATPSASSITQMALLFGQDAEYASAINVVTTLLCIVTMPMMVMLYQM